MTWQFWLLVTPAILLIMAGVIVKLYDLLFKAEYAETYGDAYDKAVFRGVRR